jgi:hypothetical protein
MNSIQKEELRTPDAKSPLDLPQPILKSGEQAFIDKVSDVFLQFKAIFSEPGYLEHKRALKTLSQEELEDLKRVEEEMDKIMDKICAPYKMTFSDHLRHFLSL